MLPEILVASIALVGLVVYAVLGGADFGGGIWDLFARGPRRDQQRAAIAAAMGPVWEANHVWLIFVVVVLFTAFPEAWNTVAVALFVPLNLVLFGIIFRGSSFVFRAYWRYTRPGGRGVDGASRWGWIFGIASLFTPLVMGMILGALSSGAIHYQEGSVTIQPPLPWLTHVAIVLGAFALAICAYVAAVYLANEASGPLAEDFRQRALVAGTVVVALSVFVLPLLAFEAPHLWENLISLRAVPILAVGVAAALASGWTLLRRQFRLARTATVVQVACLLSGWGLAQYPYLIFPDVTIHSAAAARPVLDFLLLAVPAGLVILIPSLWLLFKVFKGEYL